MNMTNTMCRMCLCGDRRMLAISNTVLQEIWEKLTNAKFITNDGKPCLVCYVCCAQLRKCSQLRKRALKAEELLTFFFSNGLKQSYETISLIAGLTNDLDSLCFNKELYQFECKQSVTNTVREFKKENDEGNEELIADDNDINIKEEEDSSDSCLQDKLDVADIESSTVSSDHTPLTSNMVLEDILQREVRIILEKIDAETPARKRMSNEVPQRAKRINLEETTKDKNDLANAVLKSLPNNKCKAFVRSSSKQTSIYTNVQNSESKPDTKSMPNCIQVDKITSKVNTLPKDNDQTENIIVQNKTLSSNLCYNDAENEILKRSLPKSADTVATSTSIHGCGQGNTSNVFNKKGPENEQLCHTYQHKCVPKNELNNHPPKHTGVQLYARDVSDNGFSIKANSDNYIKYKHAKEKKFSCHICQYKCVKKSDLIRHLRTHTGEKPCRCDFCDYRCSSKSDLKRHITYKHAKEKNFSCHLCQYKCVDKRYLKKHYLQHTGEKPYICDFCDYRCTSKSCLNRHVTYKHTKEKKFSCHICQFKCVEKGYLKKHYLQHTGEKPYICDLCDYRCTSKSDLKRHFTHKHTKEKKFSCHICQYKFVRKRDLIRHLCTHTQEKPCICDFCGYRLSSKSVLKRHITYKHTKEKKFSCHICQYKCVEKGNLKKHYLRHTGEKPYICNLCDYRCTRKELLINHIKHKHTKENT